HYVLLVSTRSQSVLRVEAHRYSTHCIRKDLLLRLYFRLVKGLVLDEFDGYYPLFDSYKGQDRLTNRVCVVNLFAIRSIDPNVRRRSEEHTSELQSRFDIVCRLLLEKKKIALVQT